jgi:hypothetical protein
MVYEDNPFNSSQGQNLLHQIFDLMFVAPAKDPEKIEGTDKIKQVTYYRSNIVNIVQKMRKFVMGYQQVVLSETEGSGLLVCPHCYRRDAIWNWETVDAGHYASPAAWLSSVELTEWEQGGANEKNRWLFMVRYRCNHVTTCNKCHQTWKGHGLDECPKCGEKDLSKVGCGEESFGKHFIRLYEGDDNIPQDADAGGTGAIERNLEIKDPNDRRKRLDGEVTGYEFVHEELPDYKIVKDWDEVLEYTPKIRFTISHPDGPSKTIDCPISELSFAVSKQNQVQCVGGIRTNKGGREKKAHPRNVVRLITARRDPPNPFKCPGPSRSQCKHGEYPIACGATDFDPPLQEIYNVFYRPYPMKIMNSQPLSAEAAGGTFRGKPVFNLYLESPVADAFKLVVPVPTEFSLNKIPRKPQVQSSQSAPPKCPNDVGGNLAAKEIMEELAEELEESLEELRKQAVENISGLDLTDADCCTAPGYTFDVCEGRSRKAYKNEKDVWIDDSPPCYSYIDNKTGETTSQMREYARWSEIPQYAGGDGKQYLGPNPNVQLIQDWLKSTKQLKSASLASPVYHYVDVIAERIDVDLGTKMVVFECKTCKNIVEAGGIIPYRQNNGQCDENGLALDNFSQAVLDAEIEYQNEYPMENDLGEPCPTAWGIDASGDHQGKKMLANPNLNIKIG